MKSNLAATAQPTLFCLFVGSTTRFHPRTKRWQSFAMNIGISSCTRKSCDDGQYGAKRITFMIKRGMLVPMIKAKSYCITAGSQIRHD
jgi:hypothetical protein